MLSSPMAFPSVYMEILPKIRSLNISIVTPGGFPDPTITEAHISIPAHSDVPPQTLGLPFEVDPSSAVIRRGKDGFDIKVSLRHQAHLPEPPNNAASDASSLEVLLHVRCHFCEHDVLPPGAAATTSRFRKVVDLPSEYWHELTDCWACHKEDYSQMPGQKGGVVLAQPGVVLVGNSYIVLHPDDVDFTALEVDLEEKAKGVLRVGRTAPAHCTNCHEPIGDFQFDQIPTSQDQVRKQVHGIKLYKYRVDFTTLASPHHPLPYRPFVSYFVNELGDSTEAHAAYRFAICEKDAAGPTFLLWVLNWNILMRSTIANPSTPPLAPDSKPSSLTPAIKVLYSDCKSRTPVADTFCTSWMNDPQVEHITLHPTLCDEVLQSLRASTVHLPRGQQQMKGFSVGFLNRNLAP